MKIEVLDTEEAVAERAASIIAEAAGEAAATRGQFAFAVSGGRTPWVMLATLARKDVPWPTVHVFQVDERVAPTGDPDRNLTHLDTSFLAHAPLRREQVHAMPVEASDLTAAAESYSEALREFSGAPPVLDLAHLGLGPDGHTASLVPGDPVLEVIDRDVGVTGVYQGRRRMTLRCSTPRADFCGSSRGKRRLRRLPASRLPIALFPGGGCDRTMLAWSPIARRPRG